MFFEKGSCWLNMTSSKWQKCKISENSTYPSIKHGELRALTVHTFGRRGVGDPDWGIIFGA